MTTTEELAKFVQDMTIDGFLADTREELKMRVLDSAGIRIDALGHEPVDIVHRTVQRANPGTDCTLWGHSETASPVGTALYNTAGTRFDEDRRDDVVATIRDFESHTVDYLVNLLA